MKLKYLSCLAISALLAFSACKKKEEDGPQEITRESVTKGNYDPNETPTERYLRIMRSLNASQSQSSQTTTSGMKTAKSAQAGNNICQLFNLQNSQTPTGCFTRKIECEDNGNIIRYLYDYGNTGCDAGDQILVGKFIYTFKGLYNFDEYDQDIDENQITTTNYQFINFGEVSSPKYNATGKQIITTDYETGETFGITEGTYEFISANEIIDIDLNATTKGDAYGIDTYNSTTINLKSDRGYTMTSETTTDLHYTSSCSINDETISTRLPISGKETIKIVENGKTVVLYGDYGDGECDDLYTITDEDGNVETINSNYEVQ